MPKRDLRLLQGQPNPAAVAMVCSCMVAINMYADVIFAKSCSAVRGPADHCAMWRKHHRARSRLRARRSPRLAQADTHQLPRNRCSDLQFSPACSAMHTQEGTSKRTKSEEDCEPAWIRPGTVVCSHAHLCSNVGPGAWLHSRCKYQILVVTASGMPGDAGKLIQRRSARRGCRALAQARAAIRRVVSCKQASSARECSIANDEVPNIARVEVLAARYAALKFEARVSCLTGAPATVRADACEDDTL